MKYTLIMTQGNNKSFTVRNNDGDFSEGDKITFSVKEDILSDRYLLKKEVTDFDGDLAVIDIMPEDTSGIKSGTYVYDVQFNAVGGAVKTIFKGDFILDWRVNDG